MTNNISNVINALKGISGSGGILGYVIKYMTDYVMTLDPGDIVKDNPPVTITVPISYDLWYLHCDHNFMARYYNHDTAYGHPVTPRTDMANHDGDHFDYKPYMASNLTFLSLITGLKPLKVLRDLEQLTTNVSMSVFGEMYSAQYENNGIYWINTMAFEIWGFGKDAQYPSSGPKDFEIKDYIGYLTFPIGQLGAMEVISLIQETQIGGYKFTGTDGMTTVWPKLPITPGSLEERDKPSVQSPPEIFADMNDANQNHCYGRHLIENAYLTPVTPIKSQNTLNSVGQTAYDPIPIKDVELFSDDTGKYPDDVKPKKWMRYWIHKDHTMPVPGEFLGILCMPVTCPPHVWFFQESAPFVYAGNWVEVGNLTSGVITEVINQSVRIDGKVGNQYKVKVQGCEVLLESSDFFIYSVGDRVAILKMDSTLAIPDKSFTWLDQPTFKITDNLQAIPNYVILPITYYKNIH